MPLGPVASRIVARNGLRRAPAFVPRYEVPSPVAAGEMIRTFGIGNAWGATGAYYGFLAAQTGETPEIKKQYIEMAFREGSIKAPLLARIYSVASLDVQVVPASKTSDRDRQIAEGYRQALTRSWLGIPHIVAEIGLGAAVQGHSLSEMPLKDEVETRGQWIGKRMIKAVKAKRPSTYTLQYDEFENLTGVRSWDGLTLFPADRFIYYPWLSLYGDLQGVADLRAAYRAFTNKDALIRLRRFFLDKMSGGFLVQKGASGEARAAMEAALKKARGLGYLVLENGQEIEMLNLAMGADDQFKNAIDDCDREMQIAMAGSHLPFQEGQTTGGRGDTQVQHQVSTQAEWKLAADCGYLLTAAAHLWVDENYANADYPTVQFGGVDPSAALQDAKLFAIAHTFMDLSKQQASERLNVSPPKDDQDRIAMAAGSVPGLAGAPGGAGGQFADAGVSGGWQVEPIFGE